MMVGLRVWLMRVLSTSLNNHDDTSSTMPSLSGLRMLLIEEEQTITNELQIGFSFHNIDVGPSQLSSASCYRSTRRRL